MKGFYRVPVFFAVLILTGLAVFVTTVYVLRANVYALYATSCLGGWERPGHVVGMPQTLNGAEAFTVENSAVLHPDTQAQIYCGGFTGEVDTTRTPQDVYVRFLWHADDVVPEATPVPIEVIDTVGTTTSDTPSTESSEDTSGTPPLEEVPKDTPILDEIEDDVVPEEIPDMDEEAADSDDAVEASESDTPEEAPISFLRTFFPYVHAEETEPTPYGFLEVLYTLDGTEWKSLGFVEAGDAGDMWMKIPSFDASTWENISKIQVALRSVSLFDGIRPTIYLDSMWLRVSYYEPNIIDDATEQAAEVLGEVVELVTPSEEISPEEVPPEEELKEPEELLDEPQSLEVIYGPPAADAPEYRVVEKVPAIDAEAEHTCTISDFFVDVSSEKRYETTVSAHASTTANYLLEIGSLPYGIDVSFDSGDYEVEFDGTDEEIPLLVEASPTAQDGNFTVQIFFTRVDDVPSTTFCQMNVINL